MRQTLVLPFGDAAVDRAARLIRAGEPVAVATETVYGLAGDATNDAAVAAIFAAKGRPSFNPLIVHVPSLAAAQALGVFTDAGLALALAHWPGPLTLVVSARPAAGIAHAATAGLATIALRVPAHPAMQALLHAVGRPLAAPSANRSGRISPTTPSHVLATLEGRIPLVLDSGPSGAGVESTIVEAISDRLQVLRPGPLLLPLDMRAASSIVDAPGQLDRHYAPAKPLRLNAEFAEPGEYLIGFGTVTGHRTLSAAGDLTEAAQRLYAELYRAEASPLPRIAIAPLPTTGLGLTLNDRLNRAAA